MSIALPDTDFNLLANKRKAKRLFQRMLTGLKIAHNNQKDMRFMTLTTGTERRYSNHYEGTGEDRKLVQNLEPRTPKDSFDILRQRIKRATVRKDGFAGFNLNKYYCLRTTEGNGVLHLIFWGGLYIPITWLRKQWYDIHGGVQADLRFVHNIKKTVEGLTGYLLDNYLLNQPIKRMSYGWGWAWLGFCRSWDNIKTRYGKIGLRTRKGCFIFAGIPSWHYYHSTKTHYRINLPRWEKSALRYDTKQSVRVWKCLSWCHPITNRQTKFYYPSRGFNKHFFDLYLP